MHLYLYDIIIITIGDFGFYGRKGILSAPIFMDNVACYGLEDKLIHCSFDTDTSEDDHINDVWVNCNITGMKEETTSETTDIVSLSTHDQSTTQATSATTEAVSPSVDTLSKESTSTTSIVALVVAITGQSINTVMIVLVVGYILLRQKRKTHTNGMLCESNLQIW